MKKFSKPELTMLDRKILIDIEKKHTITEKIQSLLHEYSIAKKNVLERCDILHRTMTQIPIEHVYPEVDKIAKSVFDVYQAESIVTFCHVYGHLLRCQLIVKKALYAIHNIPDKDVKFMYDWYKDDPNKDIDQVYFSGRYYEYCEEQTYTDHLDEDIDEDLDVEMYSVNVDMRHHVSDIVCRMSACPVFDENDRHTHTTVTMFLSNYNIGNLDHVEHTFLIPVSMEFIEPTELYEQLPIITAVVTLNTKGYFQQDEHIEKHEYNIVRCDDYDTFMKKDRVVGEESHTKLLCYEKNKNKNHLYVSCVCDIDSKEGIVYKDIYLNILFASPISNDNIYKLKHDVGAKFKIEFDYTSDEPCIRFHDVIGNSGEE